MEYWILDMENVRCVSADAKMPHYFVVQHHELIRVATKYPNIAKDYFYNTKHQTVEIIKLNGSIELAPIVGLSEVIVDIVENRGPHSVKMDWKCWRKYVRSLLG